MKAHPLPARLPPGEQILWQGAPAWRSLARGALHLRGLSLYFGGLVVWFGVAAALRGETLEQVALGTGRAALAASVPILLAVLYAWGAARSTTYTITDKRVMLRLGIAMPLTINLPFAQMDSAGLAMHSDGTGDIALKLRDEGRKLNWLLLFPYARPWRFNRAEPLLRSIPDAAAAGEILSQALAASAEQQAAQTQLPQAQHSQTQLPLAQPSRVVDTGKRNHGVTTVAA